MKGLLTAFRTLTILSWPGEEDGDFAGSLFWFPVVGLILGLILYAFACIWNVVSVGWAWGAALILVTVEVWITNGLHLDGLADWADSIGGFLQKEKRLEIMKDKHIGAFGVIALIVALMAKVFAFEQILTSGSFVWIILVTVVSRGMMVELIVNLPYARSEEGMAGAFVKGAEQKHRIASHIQMLICCLLFGLIGILSYILAWIIIFIYGRRCLKVFGGLTGDLLGTSNETVEITLLYLCAFCGERLPSYTGWSWIVS
jgi:adenosylcobinamide-GDP ribazoletransferase